MLSNDVFTHDAAEIGIDPIKLTELLARVAEEVDSGLLPSAQIAIARQGKLAAFETFGDTPKDPLYSIFSATKAITSAAAWLLIQDGLLDVSLPVIHYIPEFGANDKQEVTVEQLFTHTAGLPHAPFRPLLWHDKQATLDRFATWRLNWAPGSQYEYHPTSSMWVIAEIIERVSGQSYQDFVRSRISEPLGLLEMWVGAPQSVHHRICDVTYSGTALTNDDYKKLGIPVPPATEVTEAVLLSFNKPEIREVPVPGGGGVMSAVELALFYQALLTGEASSGEVIWQPETLNMAKRVRTGSHTDPVDGHIINRALGIAIAGDEQRNLRGFGHTNSSMAFGHSGAGGQIAWADPETGISFAYCTNGHDRNIIRQTRRSISISNRAAVCDQN